jgi:Ni,Fe-hydrogenase III large subunit
MNVQLRPLSELAEFSATVSRRVAEGGRFAALIASAQGDATRLLAIVSLRGELVLEQCVVPTSDDHYPSLAPGVAAARWYQREISDLFGVSSDDGAFGEALVYPFADDAQLPRLGNLTSTPRALFRPTPPPAHVLGEGVFTLSYGPVRSGVFESIEYVIETPGEDIPYVGTRISYKHRGVEKRFEGMNVDDGALLAERSEGVASVAHALAFCGAVEQIGDVTISLQAGFVRVMHAELERISNHLDSTIRHVEAAGQAVAFARFSLHKERVQRLRGRLCGSRFGRGVVIPGGVSGPPALRAAQIHGDIDSLEAAIASDTRLLLNTPSFLDRLRGTGVLSRETVVNYGALGPLARGSGVLEDVRYARPYAAYGHLGHGLVEVKGEGDALSRLRVRIQEIEGAFGLIRRAAEELDERGEPPGALWSNALSPASGEAIGWAEAPQGEVLTWVEVRDGRLARVKPRSASFHNLALFPMAFPKDILTDFAFIEASFGLSVAGAAS